MTDTDKAAFFAVCDKAEPASSYYLSLYREVPFYGGPEEGGWWGRDTELVAYQEFPTSEAVVAAYEQARLLALKLSKEQKDAFNQACAAECEWLEARGLDADFLPEVDGEIYYFTAIEERPGGLTSKGSRHYE